MAPAGLQAAQPSSNDLSTAFPNHFLAPAKPTAKAKSEAAPKPAPIATASNTGTAAEATQPLREGTELKELIETELKKDQLGTALWIKAVITSLQALISASPATPSVQQVIDSLTAKGNDAIVTLNPEKRAAAQEIIEQFQSFVKGDRLTPHVSPWSTSVWLTLAFS